MAPFIMKAKRQKTKAFFNQKNIICVKDFQNEQKKYQNIRDTVVEQQKVPYCMPTFRLVINPRNTICFKGKEHWLSNFYPSQMYIDGSIFHTVEHYYQVRKLFMLAGSDAARKIEDMKDPALCKQIARQILRLRLISKQQIEQWKVDHGAQIFKYAIIQKFLQHEDLRQKLLETGEMLLVYTNQLDTLFDSAMTRPRLLQWLWENDGKILQIPKCLAPDTVPYCPLIGAGKNLLGLIICQIRSQMRLFQAHLYCFPPHMFNSSDPVFSSAINSYLKIHLHK